MNNKSWVIYKHTLKDGFEHSGWSYIGQTCSKIPEKRWGTNGSGYVGTVFGKAIAKYGWDNFEHTILEANLSLEEANNREIYWINYYHTWIDDPLCCGYNMDKGGNNHCQSNLQKQRLSEINKGKPNVKNKLYKYIYKDGCCIKVMPDQLDNYLSIGWKLGNGQKGFSRNTHATKSNDICVICIETGEVFKSITKAKNKYGGNILRCLHSEPFRTAGGYHWARIDDNIRINLLKEYINKSPTHSCIDGNPCMCIETDKKYKNILEAVEETGIKTIGACCRGKIKTAGKFHWIFIANDDL